MALDNAQFISELSITDPPGTDPLSQGDDQIRTIKRATFQSFPLVAAAVNLTDVQMNLMAIKNEANIFTAIQQINEDLILNDGSDNNRDVTYQTAGVTRWQLRMANVGGGRDFTLRRYDAGGLLLDAPWTCDAATGVVDFAQPPTVLGAPIWIAGEVRQFVVDQGATAGANWFLADGTNGTANLADRWLVGAGAFSAPAGTGINAALDAQAASGATGVTALTVAQMPVHHHRIRSGSQTGITDTVLSHPSVQTVVGANRNNSASAFIDTNSGGQQFIEDAGTGNSHAHTTPVAAVTALNPTFTGSVQPLSVAVAYYQYVP